MPLAHLLRNLGDHRDTLRDATRVPNASVLLSLLGPAARGFLKQVDAVIIVAGAETSTVSQIDEVEREIAQYSNIAGIVLNKCRFMEEGYGYAY